MSTDPDTLASILRMLRSGRYCAEIASLTGVNSCTVLRIARRNGIVPKRGVSQRGKRQAKVYTAPVVQEREYRARASSLRWGNKLGGRWL